MRTHVVIGKGSRNADILFIGEGPGQQEDLQGVPFVGPAGQLLDKMLASVGLSLEDAYIANVVKCRPPGNRDPHDDEKEACLNYLRYQLMLIQPKIIVSYHSNLSSLCTAQGCHKKTPCMGGYAGDSCQMGRIEGTWKENLGGKKYERH